jgi:hypothetical protein
MGKNARIASFVGAGLLGAAGLAAYALVIRPRIQRWGASDEELARPLPGDDFVPEPKMAYTNTITIRASAAEVWPWLVQIGYKRAGWYSHDWLHRIMGVAGSVDDERRSADRIIPELQDLQIGDAIEIAPDMGYKVAIIEPETSLVWYIGIEPGTWKTFDPQEDLPDQYLSSSWGWYLDEIDEMTTRLITRVRQDYNPSFLNTVMIRGLIEPGGFIMQQGTLRGIKRRVESAAGGDEQSIILPLDG